MLILSQVHAHTLGSPDVGELLAHALGCYLNLEAAEGLRGVDLLNKTHDWPYRHDLRIDLSEVVRQGQSGVERLAAVSISSDVDLNFDLLAASVLNMDLEHDLANE